MLCLINWHHNKNFLLKGAVREIQLKAHMQQHIQEWLYNGIIQDTFLIPNHQRHQEGTRLHTDKTITLFSNIKHSRKEKTYTLKALETNR